MTRSPRPPALRTAAVRSLAGLALLLALAGCVVAPEPGYYGYGGGYYGGGYYAPAPVYVAPAPRPWGWQGGRHGGWHRDWR